MSSNTTKHTLDTICLKITDGSHYSPKSIEDGLPMLSVKDMTDYGFEFSNCKRISSGDFEKLVKSGCKPSIHDVLIAKDGSVLKHVFQVKEDIKAVLLSSIAILRPNLNLCIPQYLVYFLLNPVTKRNILSNYKSGTGVPRIVLKDFKKIEVSLPSLEYQKSVTHILSTIDNKIELNQNINQNIESIAQAIFKSWFVDFEPVHAKANTNSENEYDKIATKLGISREVLDLFPSEFEESELGLIPKGWKIDSLERCCQKVESGGTPKRSVTEYWNGSINWLTSSEVKNPIVYESKEKISHLGLKESSAKMWPAGTTVIAMYGATAGAVCLLAEPMTTNQACCGLIPRPETRLFLFLYVQFESKNLASKATGSAQQNLNKGLVATHKIIIPSKNICIVFEKMLSALFEKRILSLKEIKTLTITRDALLPKLLSGEIDVSHLNLEPEHD